MSLGGLFGGSPQTSSQGGNPKTYIPQAQPQADTLFQSIMQNFPSSPQATPAGYVYPGALETYIDYLSPTGLLSGTQGAQTAANTGAQMGAAAAPQLSAAGSQLFGAGNQLLNTAYDPQSQIFNRLRQQSLDNSGVANAAAGLGSSPYGASTTANALNNLDINWQNQMLQRQLTGTAGAGSADQSAAGLLTSAPQLAYSTGVLPYQTAQTIGQGGITGASGVSQLGNNQYALPQQLANNLESYLGLGQSASGQALTGGQMGFNQTAQGLGGLLTGANALFGGGSSGGLLSGLFGGGAGSGLGSAASGLSLASLTPAAQSTALLGGLDVLDAATAAPTAAAAGLGLGLGLLGS